MLLVVTKLYVDKEHPYRYAFVHTRILAYLKYGIETEVFVLNEHNKACNYEYEGVKVQIGSKSDLLKRILDDKNIVLCFHIIDTNMINVLKKIKNPQKVLVFVHGVEALKWYERIFPGVFSTPRMVISFVKYIFNNIYSMRIYGQFFSHTIHKCEFITVSNWMKDVTEKNWNCKGKYSWHVIPNYIDHNRFPYIEKEDKDVRNILTIRPFNTGKYANDITVKFANLLTINKHIQNLKFTFIGDGPLYKIIMNKLIKNDNIVLEKRLLTQNEIAIYHGNNGVFICPTRQDAQGVSMCEAMCSGLVPITLYNTAIPEFLPDDKNLICHDVNDMYNLFLKLVNEPETYKELSKKCSIFIRKKCSLENTVNKELEIVYKITHDK